MGVSIGQAKQQFATIIECLHREPPLLSQFAVWLDMKIAEYKLQGGMRLDFHEVVSHPDWMQGVKCRCLQTVAAKMNLQQNGGFGGTAWMFPLMETAGNPGKQSGYPEEMVNQGSAGHLRDNDTARQNGLDRESIRSTGDITDDITVPPGVRDKNNSLPDDRSVMNSASVGYPEKQSDKGEQPGAASTFLSNLAMAASYDHQKEGEETSGMSLPVRPIGEETAMESPVDEQYIGDYLADSGDEDVNSNDMLADDDDIADFDEDEEDNLPKIVSVTTVTPGGPIAYPKGFRSNKKGKSKLRINAMPKYPSKKMRVVRNYSREFKLRVIGHCLKHGTKSAMLTFDVPKTNCQRWTARVAKSSPDCGIPDTSGLESELARAEERLATWVRDTYQDSGPPTILSLQSMASTIFKHVHPDFEPAYVWVLNYLARFKLAKMVDLPCDFDDACPVTTDDLGDLC